MPLSLVEELQHDAVNSSVSTATLLRKALLIATKLDVADVPAWIKGELSGYHGQDSIPIPYYRILHGNLRAKSPRGWIPVGFPDSKLQNDVTEQRIGHSIAELDALGNGDEWIICGYPPELQATLQDWLRFPGEFGCFIGRSQILGILDEVRNRVLEWALSLEKLGVKGVGITFSDTEKKKAHGLSLHVENGNVTIQNVGQSGGHVNQATGSNAHLNIQSTDSSRSSIYLQGGDLSKLAADLEKLRFGLLAKATGPEHYAAIGAIAQAEAAAKNGEPSKVSKALSALGSAGGWALGVAKDIGVPLALAELRSRAGLPQG